jgi:hypothetical protein
MTLPAIASVGRSFRSWSAPLRALHYECQEEVNNVNLVKNVGPVDKYIRIGVGGLLMVLAATGTVGVWGWIGIVPLATGLLNTCPAYTLLGMNTNPTEKKT